uniref:Uncharacterized protein n=1 Tax=Arundo donax TaxID=35708 RepID=A0A0A8YJG1_ARUDO
MPCCRSYNECIAYCLKNATFKEQLLTDASCILYKY